MSERGRTPGVDLAGLARRLRMVREERGLAQTRLDKEAGVGRGTVGRIESEVRPEIAVGTLARVVRRLGVRLDWIVWGDDCDAVGVLAPTGLDVPIAGFLHQVHRLPGLSDWIDDEGASVPLHVIARGLKAFREKKPSCGPDGAPVQGWGPFFQGVAAAADKQASQSAAKSAAVVPLRVRRQK